MKGSTRKTKDAKHPDRQSVRPTIGLLTTEEFFVYCPSHWLSVADAVREHDANFLCFTGTILNNPDNPDSFANQANVIFDLVNPKNVDGLVIWMDAVNWQISLEEKVEFCQHYHQHYHLPVVNTETPLPGIPSVLINDYQGMYDIASHLIEVHGYRRIVFVQGAEGHVGAQERYRGYVDALAAHDLPLDLKLVTPPTPIWDGGSTGFKVLLDERKLRPQIDFEAVVAASDGIIDDVRKIFEARGILIPNDVAVTGFDNTPFSRFRATSITTVDPQFAEVGRQAVKMLFDMLAGKEVPEQVYIPAKVVIRRSCGCLPPVVEQAAVEPNVSKNGPSETILVGQRKQILAEMAQAVGMSEQTVYQAEQLVEAFEAEIGGKALGIVLSTLEDILRQAFLMDGDVGAWQNALSVLRRWVMPSLHNEMVLARAENLWQQARILIGEMAVQFQGDRALRAEEQTQNLSEIIAALLSTFEVNTLIHRLEEKLPRLGIPGCYLSLYNDRKNPLELATLMLAYKQEARIVLEDDERQFPSSYLVPTEILPKKSPYSLVVMPLCFQEEQIGIVLFEMGPRKGSVYRALQVAMSSVLQGVLLLEQVQERTAELTREKYVLDTFMETVPDRIYFKDLDSRFTRTNKAHAVHLGVNDPSQEVGKTDFDFFTEKEARLKYEQEQEIIRTGQPLIDMEEQQVRPDDQISWSLTTKMPLRDEHGNIIGTFGISRDITALKQAEESLSKERNLLRALIDTIPDYIYVKDTESRFLLVNAISATSIGMATPDEFVGKTDFDTLPREFAERTYADEQAIIKSGQPLINKEEPDINPQTGDRRWLLTTKIPFRDSQGNIAGIVGISREITDHKLAEEVLQRRNRELTLINQVSRMFSSTLEWNRVLETVLQEMRQLLNITAASFWVRIPETEELLCQHAVGPGSEMVDGWRLALGQGIVGQAAQTGEIIVIADTRTTTQHYKKVDQKIGVESRSILSIPFRLKGEVMGVLNLVDTAADRFTEDDLRLVEPITMAAASAIENARLYMRAQQEIAERKQAEEALLAAHTELKKKNEQLAELNASKDKFFSIISHDLRSPFNVMLGFSQLLDEDFEDFSKDEIKTLIAKLRESAEKLYAFLENLLTWSRVQRGAMEFFPGDVNICEVAKENLVLFLSQADQKQISVRNLVVPETYVFADYQMVSTILRNLISNALKFTSSGGVVEISARQEERSVEVAVSDTGIGISKENIPKLFRIDVQYTHTGTAGEEGTGLGLSLCKELIVRNNGTIWVESEVGKGTVFKFTLPKQPVIERNNYLDEG